MPYKDQVMHIAAQKRYQKTEKGKACGRRYEISEKGKAKSKRYYESAKGKVSYARNGAIYRKKHPERRRAKDTVYKAVKSGKLVRQPCSVCGDPKTHAHHPDYSKPLEVIWLCLCHHLEAHRIQHEKEN